jgi:hypothetical protein
MVEVNNATNGFLTVGFLLLFFIVSTYVSNQKTQDISKSMIISLHMVTMLSLLLFYAGKVLSETLIPDVLMLGILVIEGISIAGIYFARSDGL